MPDNWISTILLTGETDVSIDNVKVHDLIELNEVGGEVITIDEATQPVLWGKLGGVNAEDIINFPNMTRPIGSPHPYKIIADKYIAPIYRWQDLWSINASNSGWGPEGYADFTETGDPAMSTIDLDGISNSMGKRVEMDIVVDSADFTNDYSWLQIHPNTPVTDHLSENWFFRGDQVANNNGFSATGTLLDDGRYLFTVNFDNALYNGVLDGNLINLRTHQNMNYFDFSIAEIRVMV